IAIMWLSTAPMFRPVEEAEAAPIPASQQAYLDAEGYEEVHTIVVGRCSMCHAREPVWDGIRWAPNGVVLETGADIARAAREIYLQAGVTHAMPPANITRMTEEDRQRIVRWYRSVQAQG